MEQLLSALQSITEENPYSLLQKFSVDNIAEFSFTPLWRANRKQTTEAVQEFVEHCRIWRETKVCRKLKFPN